MIKDRLLGFGLKKLKKSVQSIDKRFLNLDNKERLNKETQKTSCKSASRKHFFV